MKIYTRTGDDGTTGLVGGSRVSKASSVIDVVGEIDELNAWLGLCCSEGLPADIEGVVKTAQCALFDLGGEVASPKGPREHRALSNAEVEALEADIDRLTGELEPLRNFILPGGTEGAARLHAARTVCRRVERRLIGLEGEQAVRGVTIAFVNRLSDWLFVAARTVNARQRVEDIKWKGQGER